MCTFEKCCFFLPLDVGCVVLGIITFVISLASAVFSIILLCIEESSVAEALEYFHKITHLDLNASSIKIILSAITVVGLIWIIFSVVLVIGIYKNKPNFVLSYYGFGVITAILWSLTGLLVLLRNHWIIAMIDFICVCVYTHCLLAVHLTYEQMLSGKLSRFGSHHDSEETVLVGSESDMTL